MPKAKQTMSIIPASTAAAIQPKPTKSEIIEALTRLKVEEIEAVNKINQAAYEKQNAICQELALECLKVACAAPASPFLAEKGEVRVHRGPLNFVEFSVRVVATDNIEEATNYSNAAGVKAIFSDRLAAEFAKLEKIPCQKWTREDDIRKDIRASMSRDSAGRVSRLLSDVESRAALSELLKVVEAGGEKKLN